MGYSQMDQYRLLWDTRDSRDGKEMHLSLPILNVGGGLLKMWGVWGKRWQHPLVRGSPECMLCLHSFCMRITKQALLSREPLSSPRDLEEPGREVFVTM